ncbi:unnamed protein product, partial [Prunus brigantina]
NIHSVVCANLSAWCSGPRGRVFNTESYFWVRCGLCAGVPARSTVRRVRWIHDRKNKLLRGRLLVLVLDLLHVVLSLVYIVGALGRRSRLDRTCMVESNQGKHGWVDQHLGS